MNFSATLKIQQQPQQNKLKRVSQSDLNDIEILCINCMKTIKVSLACEHSLHCSQVQGEVALIDQCSLVQQADFKLRKLKEALSRIKNYKKSADEYYLKMLSEYCDDILKIADFTKLDILKCREAIYNLTVLEKDFKGSSSIMIHMERLLVISKEKYGQLLKYDKEIADSNQINVKSKEELKDIVARKTNELRKSINTVSEARESLYTLRRSNYIPTQVKNLNPKMEEIISDAGLKEKDYNIE